MFYIPPWLTLVRRLRPTDLTQDSVCFLHTLILPRQLRHPLPYQLPTMTRHLVRYLVKTRLRTRFSPRIQLLLHRLNCLLQPFFVLFFLPMTSHRHILLVQDSLPCIKQKFADRPVRLAS
jgi:hypothetical protein